MALQVHLGWAENEDEAMGIAHDQWRSNVADPGTAAAPGPARCPVAPATREEPVPKRSGGFR
ncbi:hypothetical protein ABT061_03700 [Streptosporangium sp. NPDC002544]|uniref:hypothetical protein n=1 Tax=Streptosporangium sp. NPDC002544 TaxID=3154538 RepID=UPI003318F415